MGARMGGNGLAEAIQHCHGADLIAAGIAAATGGEVRLDLHEPRPTLVHILASDRGGHLSRVDGADAVRAMPGLVGLHLFADEGSFVRPYEQAGYKLGYVVLTAGSVPELLDRENAVRGTLKFVLHEQDMAVPLP